MIPTNHPPEVLPFQELSPSEPLDSSVSDLLAEKPDRLQKTNPRRLFSKVISGTLSVVEWLFGLGSMVVTLSVLAAIPILQFLSLGYMLESAARVARSGKIGEGFIGIRIMARFGAAVTTGWLLLLPLRYLSDVAFTAQIINPAGSNAERLRLVVLILTMVVGCQIVFAIARGGRIRHFFWPLNFWIIYRTIRQGGAFAKARDGSLAFLESLRLPYYFSMGFKGFMGGFLWLLLPVSLLAFGQAKTPIAPLFGFLGAFLLALVVLHLPLLQTQMAVENRFRSQFDWRKARRAYTRAPWAISFALLVTLAFALPLYLLKIEVVPQEALWLPTLVFILFIFPARLTTGWAVGRSLKRETPRHWFFRWTGRLPLLPAIAIYLLFVFFSQYTSWNGIGSLYEQHAFLLPVPFFGL